MVEPKQHQNPKQNAVTQTTYQRKKTPLIGIFLCYVLVLCLIMYQRIRDFDGTLPGRFLPGTLEINSGLAVVLSYFLVPFFYACVILLSLAIIFQTLKGLVKQPRLISISVSKTTAFSKETGKEETTTHAEGDDPLRNNLFGAVTLTILYGFFNTIALGMPTEWTLMNTFYAGMIRSILGISVLVAIQGIALIFYHLSLKAVDETDHVSFFRKTLGGLIVFDLAILTALVVYFVPLDTSIAVVYSTRQDGSVTIQAHPEFKESFAGYTKTLIIPDTYEEKFVTHVGDTGFSDVSIIGEIVLPTSMKVIGNHAFSGLFQLDLLTLNPGLEVIGQYAFRRASSLTSVVIPDTVTALHEGAFMDCRRLTSITFLAQTPPLLGRYALQNTHADLVIFVPADALISYQTHPSFSAVTARLKPLEN